MRAIPAGESEVAERASEKLAHLFGIAPVEGTRETGRRRDVLVCNAEPATQTAFGSPRKEYDAAPRTRNTRQFGCNLGLVRREHVATRGEHDIEARIGKG